MNVQEQESEMLRRDIIEGCREMWDIYLEMAKEWEPLEEEVQRLYYGDAVLKDRALKIPV